MISVSNKKWSERILDINKVDNPDLPIKLCAVNAQRTEGCWLLFIGNESKIIQNQKQT